MSAPSPGPWEIHEGFIYAPGSTVRPLTLETGEVVQHRTHLLALVYDGGTPGASGANARLIALAPRMCDFILSYIEGRASLTEADEIRREAQG